jgi:endoglucanase
MVRTWKLLVIAAATMMASASSASPGNPLATRSFYVDPQNTATQALQQHPEAADSIRQISSTPQARWFGDWIETSSVATQVSSYVGGAEMAGQMPVLVLYAIPFRDCGHYSTGGLSGPAAYKEWIRQVVLGIAGRPAAVILEPDGLAQTDCLSTEDEAARLAMLRDATNQLASSQNAVLYLDAGHSGWVPVAEMVSRLQAAGVANARGFSLNVSNFQHTMDEVSYGEQISKRIGGKAYVVDTSRNGAGPALGGPEPWCNPPGRSLGTRPTTATAGNHADAYLWLKNPGKSDGNCGRGEPAAGSWWNDYAVGLVERSGY